MQGVSRIASIGLICLCLFPAAGCVKDGQPQPASQNANTSPPSLPPSTPLIVPQNQSQPGLGSIKVGSRPMGATIILIAEDAGGGLGRPQVRGSTPGTITDLTPGKYTVHLELNGYKAAQKTVEVKPDETTTVTADLKR